MFFRRKKIATLNESPKAPPPKLETTTEADKSLHNGNVGSKNVEASSRHLDSNCNSMINDYRQENLEVQQVPEAKTRSPQSYERRASRAAQEVVAERRRTSLKGDIVEESACYRRVSVSGSRTTPKKKVECGTHVVSKSELWDTGSQHRCSKGHQNKSRVSISQEEGLLDAALVNVGLADCLISDDNVMHRSVSERNRHLQKREKPAIKPSSNICSQQCNKLSHFQSTPNVAALKSAAAAGTPKHSYNATSESELLDREILPIFQKLLTERNKSQHNIDYSFGRSCPNISIKCDIVEYL